MGFSIATEFKKCDYNTVSRDRMSENHQIVLKTTNNNACFSI